MDTSRSYYLNSRQDDFEELDADKCQSDTTDIAYVIPANDNVPTKVRLSARCRALLRLNCYSEPHLAELKPMSDVIRSAYQAASREMIAKLIKAGYLQPALRHDADAITLAIAKMKQDLRGGGGNDDGPVAA
jgi:hypothetical protein